jgi:hypothetical protein
MHVYTWYIYNPNLVPYSSSSSSYLLYYTGALLQCKDIVQSKNLRIIGIDYNDLYVQAAQKEIQKQQMNSYISVHKCDIYNQEELNNILSSENIQVVDSVYFSGSFSLLPDPQ